MSNYRPISNLCTMSKIYEKLILQQVLKIAKQNKVDLTGDSQHGFKQDRSLLGTKQAPYDHCQAISNLSYLELDKT